MLSLTKFNNPLKIRIFAVLSGSMEPALPVGSLVITQEQSSYQLNDIITAVPVIGSNKTYTHRIVSVGEKDGEPVYETKGDANEEADPNFTLHKRVIGKVVFHLPWLGRLMIFLQTQIGFFLVIILPAVILIYNEILSIKNNLLQFINNREEIAGVEKEKTK